ncbi:uncharacterized protein BJ212DRAFT_1295752 [Suillus subaureus]|uniref:Uncharacterized protein n=1 Tax=Suillus subaureus TaxID=48587 RepID=A0A9P7ELL9_9AGAM|nr:uncharacterized protein BJ212DRAFT_1295752 [Suillus subaureus]KAG1824626.1 hypothetical protein BJ212DRAFT_1295752 [Suillus subaureus]
MSNVPVTKATVTSDPPETEIPTDPLCTHPSQPIGKILVNNHTYNILELIFSSQGLVGHGTAMQGVCSVPQLTEHWLVEIGPQEVDETMSYCGKIWQSIKGTSHTHVHLVLKPSVQPLHMFWMKVELINAIQDIVRNCSLNNSMIEDDGNGSYGTLIDWEFTVHILQGQKHAIGGTGMASFMSHSLLFRLSEAVGGSVMSQNSWKHASHSHVQGSTWHETCSWDSEVIRRDWLLHLWSTDSFKENGNEKTSFFFHLHVHKFREQFYPYFHDLLPLAVEWYKLIRSKGPSHMVTFKEVTDLLTKHLNILPKDEPSPELLFTWKVIDALLGGLPDALPWWKEKGGV